MQQAADELSLNGRLTHLDGMCLFVTHRQKSVTKHPQTLSPLKARED